MVVDLGDLSVELFKLRFGQDPTQSREDLERERREAEFNRINDEIAETAALMRGREALKLKDPGFNEQEFLAGAADTFLTVWKAVAHGDVNSPRPLMSEWCYREWSQRRPARITVDRLTVRRLAIVRMILGSDAESISVRIEAHTVSSEPPVDELWTFMRKPDQLTQPGGPFGWTIASIASTVGG
jgi:predicted lipid-binding transport protein (Tim44 family)